MDPADVLADDRSGSGCVTDSEAQMLGVVDSFIQQHRDMVVEQGVNHGAAGSLPDDQAEVAQHSQLVRDRRLLHPDGGRQLTDGRRPLTETAQDTQPARGSQGLHGHGD